MSVRGRLYDWAFARRPDMRNPLQRLVCAEHRHRFTYVRPPDVAPPGMERVLFLAPTFEQALFWAREWGYFGPGWRYVGRSQDLQGYARQTVVYVCGPPNYSVPFDELLELARARGYTLIDAQDLDAVERHRAGAYDPGRCPPRD